MKDKLVTGMNVRSAAAWVAAVVFSLPPVKHAMAAGGERWLHIAILSFLLSYASVPVVRALALRLGAMDQPQARKVHKDATPLLGGVAVFLGFSASLLYNGIFSPPFLAILGAAALLLVVGVIDDVRGVSATAKLLVQIAATAGVMWYGVVLHVLPDDTGLWGKIMNIGLTLFWVVGITNAMNFFDGMDGLASGLGALMSFFLGLVAFQTDHAFFGWIALAMMGGCMGFWPYNFRFKKSALIFLGDAGSTFIGFVLACLAVYGEWSDNPVVALVSPLLIFWLLIFDMVHISVDRVATGKVHSVKEWLDYVGKDHLHHRMATILGGPRKSVLFIYLMEMCLGISALALRDAMPLVAALLLVQAAIIVIMTTILERSGRK
ncbi:MAG: MraY family glycosyltransferase [Thermodesulfobacteriota bacterium]